MNNDETKVTVGLGYTLNLGNFQSLRIDLSVSDNKREGENITDAFERVYAFVETKLAEKVKESLDAKTAWLCLVATVNSILQSTKKSLP
jgi:hypothetical protein